MAMVATDSMEAMSMGMCRIEERFVGPPLLHHPSAAPHHISVFVAHLVCLADGGEGLEIVLAERRNSSVLDAAERASRTQMR
jgi:hypothetical protein